MATLTYWTAALAGGADRGAVATAVALSPEYVAGATSLIAAGTFVADPAATDAARLYYATLDRAPDAAGLAYWTDALAHGTTRAAVALALAESPEAHAHHLGDIEAGWHLA